MKKLLVLLTSVIVLTLASCTANIGGIQPSTTSDSSSDSESEVVKEDEIIQGTLNENEVLYVYYANETIYFTADEKLNLSSNSTFERVEYTYDKKYSDVKVHAEGGKGVTAELFYSWYGNATIAIYISISNQ